MKQRTIYSCELCGLESENRAEVEACEVIPMESALVQIGDIVTQNGGGYGWWRGGEDWFYRFSEEENAERRKSHSHHAGIGTPMFVVVDIKPYADLSNAMRGAFAHRYVPILYSPDHANRGETREAFGWTGGSFTVRGKVNPGQLAQFQERAKALGRPAYFSY